jgi:uncharacterized protein DUF4170
MANALDGGQATDRHTFEREAHELHFVFGGELTDLNGTEFRDLSNIDIVGLYPDYASALQARKAKTQATVDKCPYALFHSPYPSSA